MSRDEGKTWHGPYQIDSTAGAYASTIELKDRSVLVVYYEWRYQPVASSLKLAGLQINKRGHRIRDHEIG